MELHIAKDVQALSIQAADFIVKHIGDTLQNQSKYTIALSGGSTPDAPARIAGK